MGLVRRWHGDKMAATYVRHKDRQSETSDINRLKTS